MDHVTSRDGTKIGYDRRGSGEPLILVDGALCHRGFGPTPKIAGRLAEHFTVYTYDRRGRGESDDAAAGSFDARREVEDAEALIAAAGGGACLAGFSSGGALALEVANQVPGVRGLALYEVPFITDADAAAPADFASHMRDLVAADDRSGALRYFMGVVGMPAIMIGLMRMTPPWRKLKRVAHTLPYDAALVKDVVGSDLTLPTDRWHLEAPVTVIDGGKSPESMRAANGALAEVLGAGYRTLEGQTHMVKPAVLAPALVETFKRRTTVELEAA